MYYTCDQKKKPEWGSATQTSTTTIGKEGWKEGKEKQNIVNSQSGYKKLYVALVAYVYQLGNFVSASWYNKGTIILLP